MASSFEAFVAQRFPQSRMVPLSKTNNDVYRVTNDDGSVVVKLVTDGDIPLEYLVEVTRVVARRLPTQAVREIHAACHAEPFDAVVSDYIEGVDLAAVLGSDAACPLDRAATAAFLVDFLDAMLEVLPLRPGFGLYKRKAPTFATHREFIEHYARRYWNRSRSFFDDRVQRTVDQWIDGGFAAATIDDQLFGVTAIDANLKNFIVTANGSLAVLNVPIVGLSSIAHAVGAISVNLRHHPERDLFLREVARRRPEVRLDLVAHFELWNMLGLLSFYADRHPDRPQNWRNFGSPRPLRDDFITHLDQHFH